VGFIRKKIGIFRYKNDSTFVRICSLLPFGEVIYYSIFNKSFLREMKSVFRGKIEYLRALSSEGGGNGLLRRNIHRIEKGLSMKNRRATFATDYIEETVNAFCSYSSVLSEKQRMLPSTEYAWFRDVLAKYFETSGDDARIERAKGSFLAQSADEEMTDCVPFLRDLATPLNCSYDSLMQLAVRRRSVRWFLDKQVPRDLVEKAIEVGLYSASACNRQPFSFRIFDDPKRAAKIAQLAMGTTGYNDQIPCIIVVLGHLDAYFAERDRHLIYIDSSLAVTPMMMACETLGLSTCAINWPDIEARETLMQAELNLSSWERPIMLLAVGYPDPEVKVPRSVKKEIKDIVKWV